MKLSGKNAHAHFRIPTKQEIGIGLLSGGAIAVTDSVKAKLSRLFNMRKIDIETVKGRKMPCDLFEEHLDRKIDKMYFPMYYILVLKIGGSKA